MRITSVVDTLRRVTLLVALILLGAQVSQAQKSGDTTASVATVKSIDKPAKNIEVVTDQGKQLKLGMTDATIVTNGTKKASVSDISPGDKVGVLYNKNTALDIRLNGELPGPNPVVWPKRSPTPNPK